MMNHKEKAIFHEAVGKHSDVDDDPNVIVFSGTVEKIQEMKGRLGKLFGSKVRVQLDEEGRQQRGTQYADMTVTPSRMDGIRKAADGDQAEKRTFKCRRHGQIIAGRPSMYVVSSTPF